MNIVITGTTGFIGQHLAAYFAAAGHNVYATTRDAVASWPIGVHVDAIIHAAATSTPPAVPVSQLVDDNVRFTDHIARLAAFHRVPYFIFLSSVSAFGTVKTNLLNEDTPTISPISPYGTTKLLCEQLLADCPAFRSLSIRLPAVLGKGAKRHWWARTAENALANRPIKYHSAYQPFNNAVHVEDLARFILHAIAMYDQVDAQHDKVLLASLWPKFFVELLETFVFSLGSTSTIEETETKDVSFLIDVRRAVDCYSYIPRPITTTLARYVGDLMPSQANAAAQ